MKVRVYDSRNFNLIQTLDHSSADCERRHAPSVALGECYQPLLLTGTVGEARVYDTSKHSWKLVDTLGHPSSCGVTDSMVSAVAFSRGARVTVSGCKVHVSESHEYVSTLEHPSPVSAIAVSTKSVSSGHHFLATAYDNTMRVYDTRHRRVNADPALTLEYSSSICSLAFHSTEAFLVVGLADGRAHVYDTHNWIRILTLDQPGRVVSAAFHPTHAFLATACSDGKFRVFDSRTWQLLGTVSHPLDHSHCLAFHPSEPLLVTAGGTEHNLSGVGGARVHNIDHWL